MIKKIFSILLIVSIAFVQSLTGQVPTTDKGVYNVGILIMEGVYNTELTAPYDIFQHTIFRKNIKPMRVFTIAGNLDVITTFEGLRIIPDFSYRENQYPAIDILVIPSAEHHLDTDLTDTEMISWVRNTAATASFITSHCDGAFVLAKSGILQGYASTTFPADIPTYRNMFPELDVIEDVTFVHDGPFITSAGGARSFDAALYLCEVLYGPEIARELAEGLVLDWDLRKVSHKIIKHH